MAKHPAGKKRTDHVITNRPEGASTCPTCSGSGWVLLLSDVPAQHSRAVTLP